MNSRQFMTAVALVAATSWPAAALAQRVEHGRGNIVSIDQNRGTLELKDPQGRIGTWQFNRNATVKFTDGRSFFPNPSVADLRPPMYVHFTFSNELIDSFDVVELGFQPGGGNDEASSSSVKQQGTPRTITGRVTAYDASVRQVEIEHNGRRETFQLTDSSNQRFSPGDRVQLRTDWTGQRELVVDARVLGVGGGNAGRNSTIRDTNLGGTSTGRNTGTQTAEGRVVRISTRGVVMQVAGSQQTYAVEDAQLLKRLRVGDTVQFSWREEDNRRLYITDVR